MALEVRRLEAVEGRPREESVLGPVRLVVGGHVELRVPQSHADVVQQPRQRTQFENGILQDEKEKRKKNTTSKRLKTTRLH